MQTTISKIDAKQVMSVYSGRPGCCCGCRGKHSYASAYREQASKDRGYVVDDDEVSDRSVKIIVNKINAVIESGDYDVDADNDGFVSFETPTRVYVAYLLEGGAA